MHTFHATVCLDLQWQTRAFAVRPIAPFHCAGRLSHSYCPWLANRTWPKLPACLKKALKLSRLSFHVQCQGPAGFLCFTRAGCPGTAKPLTSLWTLQFLQQAPISTLRSHLQAALRSGQYLALASWTVRLIIYSSWSLVFARVTWEAPPSQAFPVPLSVGPHRGATSTSMGGRAENVSAPKMSHYKQQQHRHHFYSVPLRLSQYFLKNRTVMKYKHEIFGKRFFKARLPFAPFPSVLKHRTRHSPQHESSKAGHKQQQVRSQACCGACGPGKMFHSIWSRGLSNTGRHLQFL